VCSAALLSCAVLSWRVRKLEITVRLWGWGALWHRGNRSCWTVGHSGCATLRDPVWLVERLGGGPSGQPRQSFYPIVFRDINFRCTENEVSVLVHSGIGVAFNMGWAKTNTKGKPKRSRAAQRA